MVSKIKELFKSIGLWIAGIGIILIPILVGLIIKLSGIAIIVYIVYIIWTKLSG